MKSCPSLGKCIPLALLFVGVFGFAVVPAARAQLSFTITPVGGHVDQYTVTVTSSGFTTPIDDQTGASLTTDSAFFSGVSSGSLVAGSITTSSSGSPPEPAVTQMAISGSTLSFQFESSVMGSFTYYDLSGSATSTFESGSTYADLTPGTYNFVSGGGAFDNASNYGGTLTIQAAPIPEPATYAGLLALVALGFALYRRRRG